MKVSLALLLVVAIISGSSSLKCNLFGDYAELQNGEVFDEVNEEKDMETCGDDMSCMNMQGSADNGNLYYVVKDVGGCIETNFCTDLNELSQNDKAGVLHEHLDKIKSFKLPAGLTENSEDPIKIQCCETEGCNKMKNSQENSSGKNSSSFLALLCVLPAIFLF